MNYDDIPAFVCKPGCSDCCGPHPWSPVEHQRIMGWLAARGRHDLKATDLACPYIWDGGCSIYEVRPFVCRLYGTVEKMLCPHGCRPPRLLTGKEEQRLMRAYMREMQEEGA